jgi:hypothetical protein
VAVAKNGRCGAILAFLLFAVLSLPGALVNSWPALAQACETQTRAGGSATKHTYYYESKCKQADGTVYRYVFNGAYNVGFRSRKRGTNRRRVVDKVEAYLLRRPLDLLWLSSAVRWG